MEKALALPDDKLIEEANSLHTRFVKSIKKGAAYAFEIGKILKGLYMNLAPTESWPGYVAEHFLFTPPTANTYIRVYETYKDDPKLLAEQTISGALKLLSSPREKHGPVEYGSPDKQLAFPLEELFSRPPLSKAQLKNHRFECVGNHDIYLARKDLNYPVKIVDLLTDDPGEHLKAPYRGMLEAIQSALELYYAEVERLEAINK